MKGAAPQNPANSSGLSRRPAFSDSLLVPNFKRTKTRVRIAG